MSAWEIANIYDIAGEDDLAIDWFEKAYENHDLSMPLISGFCDPLHSYPRIQDLLRKMNLPVDVDK